MKTCRKGARGSVDLYTARTEAEHRKRAMMRGPLIQTEARTILNRGISQGISETKKETALRMLKMGKLTVEEIAEYSALSVAEVEPLANPQTI